MTFYTIVTLRGPSALEERDDRAGSIEAGTQPNLIAPPLDGRLAEDGFTRRGPPVQPVFVVARLIGEQHDHALPVGLAQLFVSLEGLTGLARAEAEAAVTRRVSERQNGWSLALTYGGHTFTTLNYDLMGMTTDPFS